MDSMSISERYRRVRSLSTQYESSNRVVDWSYRQLKTLDGLQCLADTHHLILDGNCLDRFQLPFMPFLKTLSVNENKITDLDRFCDNLRQSCPSLTHLSMIGNPAYPHPLTGGDENQYSMYRRFILSKLPQLKFLDSTVVDSARIRIHTEPSVKIAHEFVHNSLQSIMHRIGLIDQKSVMEDKNNNRSPKSEVKKIDRPYKGVHSEGNRFIKDNQL